MAQNRLVNINAHHMAVGMDTLIDLMRHGKDDRVRGTAAQALLERGWGKPRAEVAATNKSNSESFIEALQEVAERVKERQITKKTYS